MEEGQESWVVLWKGHGGAWMVDAGRFHEDEASAVRKAERHARTSPHSRFYVAHVKKRIMVAEPQPPVEVTELMPKGGW